MKAKLLLTTLVLAWLLPFLAAAADTAAKPVEPDDPEVKALVAKISGKVRDNKRDVADYTEEIKALDDIIAAKRKTAPESAAFAAFIKASIYTSVLRETVKGNAMLTDITKDFPGTFHANRVTEMNAAAERKAKAQVEQAVGKKFPGFSEKDLDGKPLSIAAHKGKIVLVDFWATWCGPCIGELPNVKKTYAKYHQDGFEVVGISLDSDKQKLTDFIAKNEMPWAQFFDGQGWKNKLAEQYSIQSIPATFLLDGEGTIIAKDLRGELLEAVVGKALKK